MSDPFDHQFEMALWILYSHDKGEHLIFIDPVPPIFLLELDYARYKIQLIYASKEVQRWEQ